MGFPVCATGLGVLLTFLAGLPCPLYAQDRSFALFLDAQGATRDGGDCMAWDLFMPFAGVVTAFRVNYTMIAPTVGAIEVAVAIVQGLPTPAEGHARCTSVVPSTPGHLRQLRCSFIPVVSLAAFNQETEEPWGQVTLCRQGTAIRDTAAGDMRVRGVIVEGNRRLLEPE